MFLKLLPVKTTVSNNLRTLLYALRSSTYETFNFQFISSFRTFATAETSLSKISSKVQQSRRLRCVLV